MNDMGKVMRILEDLRGLHVTNPRDAEFASQLHRLLAHDADGNPLPSALRFTSTGETRGIMVVDEPGGGKSTLVQRGLDRCVALQAEPGAPKRYLDAVVPSPATLKSMTRELLKDSGYPDVSKSREVWSMMELLRERISMLGIVAIWIDEAHDLFCADRNLILRALKSLMQGEAAVIVILSGTSALAEVVRSDPQVQRRFTNLILPPVDPKADGVQIAGLIETYCQRAGLAPPAERDLVERVAHAARYRFGRTVEAVVNAIECALTGGADQLDIDHFAEAYALHEGAGSERNVFLVEDWWNLRPEWGARRSTFPAAAPEGQGVIVMQLRPQLPFKAEETVLSWASRLAAFHTGGRLVPFLNDLGIAPNHLSTGDEEALLRLAAKAGQDLSCLRRNAITRIGPRQYRLRHETFSAEFTTGAVTRFCPACLAADDAGGGRSATVRMHRLDWLLQPVRICPHHSLPLVERRRGDWDDFLHELPVLVPETREQLLRMADASSSTPQSQLQGYVSTRLQGGNGPEWLDRQSIEQAVRATEMLGAVLAFGPGAKPGDLGMLDWVRAADSGWPYVSQGEPGIRKALEHLQEDAKGRGRAWLSRTAVFGMLYRWLSSNKLRKDPGNIRDILRRHIVDRMDIAPGESVLGKEIRTPKLCSVTTLAKSDGVHALTLRDVLISRGALERGAASRSCGELLVDARVGRKASDAIRWAVPFTRAGDILNASRPMVSTLIEIGALSQVRLDGEARGKLSRSIDEREMRELLRRLENLVPDVVERVPPGMATISQCLERSRLTNELVLRRLLSGQLRRVFRLEDVGGFKGVVLDPKEFSTPGNLPLPGMSLEMAMVMFGLNRAAINSLVLPRDGGALLDAIEVQGRYGKWVLPEALERFRERFVFGHRLELEYGIKRPAAKSLLEANGVEPLFNPREFGAMIYRRADLPSELSRRRS